MCEHYAQHVSILGLARLASRLEGMVIGGKSKSRISNDRQEERATSSDAAFSSHMFDESTVGQAATGSPGTVSMTGFVLKISRASTGQAVQVSRGILTRLCEAVHDR
jgi:hypothetical protein